MLVNKIASIMCSFKGRVQCFSMQVVINKCFLLNPVKKFDADLSLEKIAKTTHFNCEKMASPSQLLESYSPFQARKPFIIGFRKPETDF